MNNKYQSKNGYVLSRNQCSVLIRLDGEEIEVPVSFGLTPSEIRNLYPFLLQICNKKVKNPAMNFTSIAKDSAFDRLTDEDYDTLLKFVQKESLYWSSKPEASILELSMRIAVDIALDPDKGIRNVLEALGVIVSDSPLRSQGQFGYNDAKLKSMSSVIKSEVQSIMDEVIDDEYASPLNNTEDDKYNDDNSSTGVNIYGHWSSGDLDDEADKAAIEAYDREIAEMEARVNGKSDSSTLDESSDDAESFDSTKSDVAGDDMDILRTEISKTQDVYAAGMRDLDNTTSSNIEKDANFNARLSSESFDDDNDLDEDIESYLGELSDEEYEAARNPSSDSEFDDFEDSLPEDDDTMDSFEDGIEDEFEDSIDDFSDEVDEISEAESSDNVESNESVELDNSVESDDDVPEYSVDSDDEDDSFINIYGSFADDTDDVDGEIE